MNDCRDKLELKYGRRDLLETLDEARERVVSGETEAILLIELKSENETFWRAFSWKDDMRYRWTRYVSALSSVLNDILNDGLQAE